MDEKLGLSLQFHFTQSSDNMVKARPCQRVRVPAMNDQCVEAGWSFRAQTRPLPSLGSFHDIPAGLLLLEWLASSAYLPEGDGKTCPMSG